LLSRLDVVAIAAWLLMGTVVFENARRVDQAEAAPAPVAQTTETVAAVEPAEECRPYQLTSEDLRSFFISAALAAEGPGAFMPTFTPCRTGDGRTSLR
jgi:hypothetical protein